MISTLSPKFRNWQRTLGAPEDPVATDTTSEWSAMSLLKALYANQVEAIAAMFSTKAEVESANIPATVDAVRTAGYAAAGDGGAALYKRAASEPAHSGKFQSADGGWWEIAERSLDPRMFGAKPSGSDDDAAANTTAFQNAIDVAAAIGATVDVPPAASAYHVAKQSDVTYALALKSGVALRGTGGLNGAGGAALKLAANQNDTHVLSCTDVDDWEISGLEIDANATNNTGSGHGIRTQNVNGGLIERNYIHDCLFYGIGNEAGLSEGSAKDVLIQHNLIADTNSDGIDFKDYDDGNENIVVQFNTLDNTGRNDPGAAVAIDVRCAGAKIIGNTIRNRSTGTANNSAITARSNSGGDGSDGAVIAFNRIYGTTGTTDISVAADGVMVMGNTIDRTGTVGTNDGINVTGLRASVIGNTITGVGRDGILFASGANYGTCLGNSVDAADGDGIQIASNNVRAAFNQTKASGGWGIRIVAGATGTRLLENEDDSSTSGAVTDAGTGTTFKWDAYSSHGADIASAATLNLDAATGDLVDVTGTTGITAITMADGRVRTVRFTGALTLTNGASLVLPSGANITTAAGDYAIFRGYAAGVVRCVGYFRASGKPVAGIGTQDANAVAITGGDITGVTDTEQSSFPSAPASGKEIEFSDDTGRRWSLLSSGILVPMSRPNAVRRAHTALNNSATLSNIGLGTATDNGTATAVQANAGSDYFTRTIRTSSLSAASAAANCGKQTSSHIVYLNEPGLVTFRFGWEVFQANAAAFIGLRPSAVHGDVDPSSFVNIVGIGIDSGQTTWRTLVNDATGSATAADLGANFPANTSATDWYELTLWWGSAPTKIYYQLVRMNTGHVAKGTFTSDLPSLTTALLGHIVANTRSGTAAIQISMAHIVAEVG